MARNPQGNRPFGGNLCTGCGQDFNSVRAFDKHRVGKHEFLFDHRDEATWDGRRCLAVEEMKELGWLVNDRGRWIDRLFEMSEKLKAGLADRQATKAA